MADDRAGEFNETIHAPVRLRICGLLRAVDGLDFAVVRDAIEVSDATLSKHLKVLVDAGFVAISKSPSLSRSDSRRVTWLLLTRPGARAFDSHVRALRQIGAAASS